VFNPAPKDELWVNARTMVQIVTDDMPFLVDSVTGELVAEGIDVHLIVHPQFMVRRDVLGHLEGVLEVDPQDATGPAGSVGDVHESWMTLTIDRETDEQRQGEIAARIRAVLSDVREAVEDWPKMRSRCLVIAAETEGSPPPGVAPAEVARTVAFLRWMADNHYTFLGYREYRLAETEAEGEGSGEAIVPVTGTGLGLLRSDPVLGEAHPPLTEEAQLKAHEPTLLIVTKANSRSTVHRRAFLDYVGVKAYDARGRVVGERRFLGLYAATAYTDSVTRLPLIAEKVKAIIKLSGVAPGSHTAKDLLGVLETFPRDELFQASVEQLYEVAIAVTRLQERRYTRLFLREDDYGRFVSAIVYIPRDRYNTAVRLRMAEILKDAFEGVSIEFSARVSESALSRIHYVIRMPKGERVRALAPEERDALEQHLVEVSRTWSDRLADAVFDKLGEAESDRLMARFGRGFSTAYEETFTTSQGVADLAHLDRLGEERPTSVALYRPVDAPATMRRFKLFRTDPLSLTDILPIFAHMGVEVIDEQPYEVDRSDGTRLHVYDFGLRVTDAAIWDAMSHERLRELFEGAVAAVWDGLAESDGFNKLVLAAQLSWRQVVILRMVSRYLRQTQSTFSQEYLEDGLVSNPHIAADLVALFETRFDPDRYAGRPDGARSQAEEEIAARVLAALDEVASLDHDRIIRAFLGVVRAGLRTNYFQEAPSPAARDEAMRQYVSLKLDPSQVPDLPAPRPKFEIWVYSPRVEGVHLRFGPVARGGLRWSDRREDFRTEILGLVKAQMVKNAVIVPTGSKGGFFPKQLPDPALDRDAWLTEGKAAYRMFISGLLDVTDNRVKGEIIPPGRTVRHDADDPYLVVAADKGTATFSDIANGVAQAYGFWLDDAFASGGSAGYDHKAMGITAKGAWESVKRHFREMGVDTQSEDFTVVGIGDMSGDVFGNGMLLSPHIKLVAAFDHRHVFIDPDPDPAASFAERERMFALPRSSWDDYDKGLISAGGGVFRRSLKSVAVTPQMREALGLPDGRAAMTPAELIHAILLAPVDLLWNGGIGTYVKASTEEHLAVGDRANDAIRVDGDELRVKVVGEGGNLGLSQLGRIEAARHGVRVNTDAVDNSAGVDTSDHEVNIKILLGDVIRRGEMSLEERNELLVSMTDEIAEQVLRDNFEQNVLIGNARAQQASMAPVHIRLMRWLEERGELDRSIEFLPSDAELDVRHHEGRGLTSPELCVLLAYAKLAVKKDLLASDLPDDPFLVATLASYFPTPLREGYAEELAEHPLRREIVANSVANAMINRGGITFVYRAMEETGGTAVQTRLHFEFRRLLDRAVRWFLASRATAVDIRAEIDRFAEIVAELGPSVPDLLRGDERRRLEARAADYEGCGVPPEMATRAASLLDQYSLLDIVDIAADTSNEPTAIAPLYYFVSESFGIDTMLTKVTKLPREDRWDALARGALRDDLYAVLESMTRAVLDASGGVADVEPAQAFEVWAGANVDVIQRARTSLGGILRLETPTIAALSVALRTLRSVIRAGSSGG
jgi:glutamate dehydrogenase